LIEAFNRGATLAWRTAVRRLYMSRSQEEEVVAEFTKAYAASAPKASWMGEPVTTSPFDLWVYQEIVHETQPDVIIAVRTSSAGYLADLCQMADRGIVFAIEASPPDLSTSARHPRIRRLQPSSVTAELAGGAESVLVVLGSRSAGDPLAEELRLYGPLVSAGSYLIVEDTTRSRQRAGDAESFVRASATFTSDRCCEKLLLTDNASGYLKRHP
jgi:cephalosporin hydroxylase